MNWPKVLCIAVALCFSACSSRQAAAPVPELEPEAPDPISQPPFLFRVVEDYNDGRSLYVAGEVEVLADWETSDLLIRLATMNFGETVAENYFSLPPAAGQAGDGRVKARQVVPFALSASAAGMTDYQLELLWGREARERRPESVLPGGLPVELRNVQVSLNQCSGDPCPAPYSVAGEIFNSGTSTLNEITLGVALSGAGSQGVPANEETVHISGLGLEPGQGRSFRLTIEKPVPQSMLSLIQPVLRVLPAPAPAEAG